MAVCPRLTDLNYNEVLLYLGYRGQDIDEALDGQIRRCMASVAEVSCPRLVYRRIPKTSMVLPGKDVEELLSSSEEVIVAAVTLGSEAEALLRKTEVMDMADAVIMDSAMSVAVENVSGNLESDLAAAVAEEGLFLTDRFSPGYGDLPLAVQPMVLEVLDAGRRIGLSTTGDGLMVPRKSVTFVMGVSRVEQRKRKRGCEECSMFLRCRYRKEGRECR